MTRYRISPSKSLEELHTPLFECTGIASGDTVRIVVAGELDIATVRKLDRVIRDAESIALQIVLDLGGVVFVASCGAQLLMEADARIRSAGGKLTIERAPDALRRILELICGPAELADGELPTTSPARPGRVASGLAQ